MLSFPNVNHASIGWTRIESPQNPSVKQIRRWRTESQRRSDDVVVVDSLRLIERAITAGWPLRQIFASLDQMQPDDRERLEQLLTTNKAAACYNVSPVVLEKIAYGQTAHPIGIFEPKRLQWTELSPSERSTVCVLDRCEKPGNVGAVARTCAALDIDALILSDPHCDYLNPNALRASTGAVFNLPIVTGTTEQAIGWLVANNYQIFTLRVESTRDYAAVEWPARTALIFGSEAYGLGERWSAAEAFGLTIPMTGRVDSLNLSATAAIVMADLMAVRRRKSL